MTLDQLFDCRRSGLVSPSAAGQCLPVSCRLARGRDRIRDVDSHRLSVAVAGHLAGGLDARPRKTAVTWTPSARC